MITPLSTTASTTTGRRRKKTISWDSVEIREYPIVLAVNPATKMGPSVELGWNYFLADNIECTHHDEEAVAVEPYQIENGIITVDLYEAIRPSAGRHHQVLREMYLNSYEREALLEKFYSAEEITQAVNEKKALAAERTDPKTNPTAWSRSKPRRIRKIKRAVKNLNQKHIPRNIYSQWWLPLQISL